MFKKEKTENLSSMLIFRFEAACLDGLEILCHTKMGSKEGTKEVRGRYIYTHIQEREREREILKNYAF